MSLTKLRWALEAIDGNRLKYTGRWSSKVNVSSWSTPLRLSSAAVVLYRAASIIYQPFFPGGASELSESLLGRFWERPMYSRDQSLVVPLLSVGPPCLERPPVLLPCPPSVSLSVSASFILILVCQDLVYFLGMLNRRPHCERVDGSQPRVGLPPSLPPEHVQQHFISLSGDGRREGRWIIQRHFGARRGNSLWGEDARWEGGKAGDGLWERNLQLRPTNFLKSVWSGLDLHTQNLFIQFPNIRASGTGQITEATHTFQSTNISRTAVTLMLFFFHRAWRWHKSSVIDLHVDSSGNLLRARKSGCFQEYYLSSWFHSICHSASERKWQWTDTS